MTLQIVRIVVLFVFLLALVLNAPLRGPKDKDPTLRDDWDDIRNTAVGVWNWVRRLRKRR